jgi:stage II sporulation protein R
MKAVKNRKKRNLLTISMLTGSLITFIYASFASFARQCEELSGEVLRLHILANSDSTDDQRLKYLVRDFIIENADDLFTGAVTLEEAAVNARNNLVGLEENIEKFIKEQGYDYGAEITLVNMFFATRVYENITMPAGSYEALQVKIGSGEGRNWWCVVFPPLCLPAVTEVNNELFISAEVSSIINNDGRRVEVRFAVYEWFLRRFR